MSETLHATAVVVGMHGLLIRGASGAGKSVLAFSLMERGARLIADDGVHLSACHGRLVASAPASIAGLIELRGRGLLRVPYERSGTIALVVDMVDEDTLERMPEDAEMRTELIGVTLPRQPIPAATDWAVHLVDAALAKLSPQCNMGLRSARVWG